ncbi:hypothetical protein C8J57DRAFT_1721886 [Mycena rebaudengoi]|nr:hypothetical protein C8J57DRAFT_1721886 [Mycena rebaudengoi]
MTSPLPVFAFPDAPTSPDASDLAALDISGFSTLAGLKIKENELGGLLLALPALSQLGPTNVVRCLTLATGEFESINSSDVVETTLRDLDTQLAALPWPALLTVHMVAEYGVADEQTLDVAQIMRENMTAIGKIARLVVTKEVRPDNIFSFSTLAA